MFQPVPPDPLDVLMEPQLCRGHGTSETGERHASCVMRRAPLTRRPPPHPADRVGPKTPTAGSRQWFGLQTQR